MLSLSTKFHDKDGEKKENKQWTDPTKKSYVAEKLIPLRAQNSTVIQKLLKTHHESASKCTIYSCLSKAAQNRAKNYSAFLKVKKYILRLTFLAEG